MPKKLVKGFKDGKVTQTSFVGNSKSLFSSLKTTKDLVLLSIAGNELCAGEYLQGIVKQAVVNHEGNLNPGEQRGKTTFLIADEIYWHNLKKLDPSDNDVADLKAQATQLGDSYFTDNIAAFLAPLGLTPEEFNNAHGEKTVTEKIAIINELAAEQGKNFEIVRWQTWVSQDSTKQIEKMIPLYESVEGLSDSISLAVNDFAKRHSDDNNPGSKELWKHRSRDYLTEECPSVMWLAASLGYNFVIYPGEMIPPFGTTKDFFVVGEHKARIENGANIKEACTHSEFCIHVKDPRRLVNWLEVHFQKSPLTPPKKPEMVESEQSVPVPPKQISSTVLRGTNTFFAPTQGNNLISNENNTPLQDEFVLERTSTEGELTGDKGVSNEQRVLMESLITGINQALGQEEPQIPSKQRKSKKHEQENLTDMFRGIALGIMETPTMSVPTKLEILTKLVDDFTSKHIPQVQLSLQKKPPESCPASDTPEPSNRTRRVL
ncbi:MULTISPECIES: hypothetical protein [unclassified Legionella]|uniref:hypothetical protein n=1 Tax=unclassified Legionella TaxID=2622702 RepID=UPI003AF914E1